MNLWQNKLLSKEMNIIYFLTRKAITNAPSLHARYNTITNCLNVKPGYSY